MPTASDYERMLRGAELRVTRPRVAVLDAVHTHPHADTESIIAAARRDLEDVSHQAVYDVLRALTVAGLVRRIQPSGTVARYEARVGDNHHHVICRSCGVIADVDCAVGEAPCLIASDDNGFMNKVSLAVPGRKGGGGSEGGAAPAPKGRSHIRQARPKQPEVKLPETGPMAAMLKKLFGKD